jgi:tRNA-2-methylthio-N6-dimethylallyladenosine synthase
MSYKSKTKKVYLETYGCQMNVSDSERVTSLLNTKGYEMTSDEDSADVVLINTCSVREKAENKLYSRVGRLREKADKPIVGVMGCVAQLEGETLFERANGVDFVIGTRAVGRVHEAIEKAFEQEMPVLDLGEREFDYDWTVGEKSRYSPFVAFVPIIEGCNKFCTYCIVPFSRGRERSLPATEIIRQVLELKRQGVKEVHLIGQNVNSYRPQVETGLELFKGATLFSRLLRAVAATGMERIKFTTSFPRDFHPDIVKAIDEHENLCNFVHLPVQSGSDNVLRAMRRGHTADDYKKRVDIIRNSKRNITLTTDLIVGFPHETLEDFQSTMSLFQYCQYDSGYIYKYSVRSGTIASEMPDNVLPDEKTRRFLELEKLQKAFQQISLQKQLNQTLDVLVESLNNKIDGQLTGHTTCHRVVNFTGNADLLGKIVKVKITEIKSNTLFGVLL